MAAPSRITWFLFGLAAGVWLAVGTAMLVEKKTRLPAQTEQFCVKCVRI